MSQYLQGLAGARGYYLISEKEGGSFRSRRGSTFSQKKQHRVVAKGEKKGKFWKNRGCFCFGRGVIITVKIHLRGSPVLLKENKKHVRNYQGSLLRTM